MISSECKCLPLDMELGTHEERKKNSNQGKN